MVAAKCILESVDRNSSDISLGSLLQKLTTRWRMMIEWLFEFEMHLHGDFVRMSSQISLLDVSLHTGNFKECRHSLCQSLCWKFWSDPSFVYFKASLRFAPVSTNCLHSSIRPANYCCMPIPRLCTYSEHSISISLFWSVVLVSLVWWLRPLCWFFCNALISSEIQIILNSKVFFFST